MRSTSSSDSAVEPEIVIFCSWPVPRSFADTLTMPLASMSKVTSICGMPRGAAGMPVSWKMCIRDRCRAERQAHAYAGNKRPKLAKLPENKRDGGGHAHGRARHQDEHAKVMTDGRDIGPVKTGQHNMRIIAVIAVAGTDRDGVRSCLLYTSRCV